MDIVWTSRQRCVFAYTGLSNPISCMMISRLYLLQMTSDGRFLGAGIFKIAPAFNGAWHTRKNNCLVRLEPTKCACVQKCGWLVLYPILWNDNIKDMSKYRVYSCVVYRAIQYDTIPSKIWSFLTNNHHKIIIHGRVSWTSSKPSSLTSALERLTYRGPEPEEARTVIVLASSFV